MVVPSRVTNPCLSLEVSAHHPINYLHSISVIKFMKGYLKVVSLTDSVLKEFNYPVTISGYSFLLHK